jgi:hypothetical protein
MAEIEKIEAEPNSDGIGVVARIKLDDGSSYKGVFYQETASNSDSYSSREPHPWSEWFVCVGVAGFFSLTAFIGFNLSEGGGPNADLGLLVMCGSLIIGLIPAFWVIVFPIGKLLGSIIK